MAGQRRQWVWVKVMSQRGLGVIIRWGWTFDYRVRRVRFLNLELWAFGVALRRGGTWEMASIDYAVVGRFCLYG